MKDHIQDIIIFILAGLIVFGIGLNYLSPKNTVLPRANALIQTHSNTVTSEPVTSEPILSETHSCDVEYNSGLETKGNYRSR